MHARNIIPLPCLGAVVRPSVVPIILPVDAENGQIPPLLGASLSLSHPSFFGCRVFLRPPPSLSQLHLMIRSRRRPRPSTQSVSPASLDTDPTLARAVIIKESYFGRTTMIALLRPPPFGPYFSFFPLALPAPLPSSILLFPSIIVLPVPSSKVNHLAVMIIFWLACPCPPHPSSPSSPQHERFADFPFYRVSH